MGLREIEIVDRKYYRRPFARLGAQPFDDGELPLRIKIGARLIEQQRESSRCERPRQLHTRPLTGR